MYPADEPNEPDEIYNDDFEEEDDMAAVAKPKAEPAAAAVAAKPKPKPTVQDAAKKLQDIKDGLALLPRGTLLYKAFPQRDVLLAEMPPGIHTIQTWGGYSSRYGEPTAASKKGTHPVAMPWQYFVFTMHNDSTWGRGTVQLCVYWAKHKMQSLDDLVIPGKIPDSEHGVICLGDTLRRFYSEPFFTQVEMTLQNFYNHSTFTSLHTGGYNYPSDYVKSDDTEGGGFAAWEKDTKESPFCYLKWKEWEGNSRKQSLRPFFTNPSHSPRY